MHVRGALAQRIHISKPIIFPCQLNDSCPAHSARPVITQIKGGIIAAFLRHRS